MPYSFCKSGTCGSVVSNTASLVVNPLTAIVTQPLASATVCSGVAQAYSVSALGGNLIYYLSNGLSTSTYINISVAGTSYRVTVTGTC